MCVKTYLNQGLITGTVGLVVVLASSLVYWLAIPDVIDNILKQVKSVHVLLQDKILSTNVRFRSS